MATKKTKEDQAEDQDQATTEQGQAEDQDQATEDSEEAEELEKVEDLPDGDDEEFEEPAAEEADAEHVVGGGVLDEGGRFDAQAGHGGVVHRKLQS